MDLRYEGTDAAMTTIGDQDGITAGANRLRDLDPKGTLLVKGADGKWPNMWQALANIPVEDWKAWDKWQRSFQILVDDHDSGGGGGYIPPPKPLASVQARIFLAGSPLDCMQAPKWMVPVLTADETTWTPDPNVVTQLRTRFALVEAWCDCRERGGDPSGTPYSQAVALVNNLGLDGPAWGQCESQAEFDHAYSGGCRRMVGNLSALRDDQIQKIATGEVLVTAELYRNCQPSMTPDWRNANAGVGGNCIACYDDADCDYMSVNQYKADGMYTSGHDSVYGVSLQPTDWGNL